MAYSGPDWASPKACSTSDVSVRIARTHEQLHALEKAWKALEDVCAGATLFQSFEWCRLAADVVAYDGEGDFFICCAYSEEQLVGLLPLRLLKKPFYTVLTGLAEPFQEFTEILVSPEVSPVEVMDRILVELSGSGVDFLHLGQVRADSALFTAVEGKVPGVGEMDAAPFVSVNQWNSFEPYLKTIKTKTRKNMRNQRNVLERTAPVTHNVAQGGEALDRIIDRTYANRAKWLEEKGLTSAAFSDDQFQGFLSKFKSGGQSGVEAIGMSLRHGEELMAEQWGFIHRDRYYAFISSYNDEYARLSPGKLHLGEVIKMGFGRQLKSMEFMLPDVPYKRTWAENAVPVQDRILGFTMTGRLYAGVWVNSIRPYAKRLVMALPESVRRPVIGLTFWR